MSTVQNGPNSPAGDVRPTTKSRALVVAKSLLQMYGFNGFSFQDIATELGIKKPSLYVHFASKEEMGNLLIQEHLSHFDEWVKALGELDPETCIRQFFEIFYTFSEQGRRYCPIAALIGDLNSLPASMQKHVHDAYLVHQRWLKEMIEKGQAGGTFESQLDSAEVAHSILAIGLGSQLIGRVLGDPSQIRLIANDAIRILKSAPTTA